MLLYLTSDQNVGLFDFLNNEKGIGVRPMNGEFDLLKFVKNDMRSLSHFGFLAIDLLAIKNTTSEIIDSLKAFEKFYDSRIIILAEGYDNKHELIPQLIENKIYNIITATTVEGIRDEIRKCISLEGMTYHDTKRFTEEAESDNGYKAGYRFKNKDIKIAVVGVGANVGTTTSAVHLALTLDGMGAKVSYTEANDSGHLKTFASHYDFELKDNFYSRKGIEFYPNKQFPSDYHFTIFDFGALSASIIPILNAFDIRIVCTGSKPYELQEYQSALKLIQGVYLNSLLLSAPDSERLTIKSLYEKPYNKIHFSGYAPNFFDYSANENIFKEILKDYYTVE